MEEVNPAMEEVNHALPSTSFPAALISGAAAGTAVDVVLFPLDTIKTRLQSQAGFLKSGGFSRVYSGLLSAALGSAPGGALFFCAYETSKKVFGSLSSDRRFEVASQMAAACIGEVTACLVRVPVEVVKQRAQVESTGSSISSLRFTLRSEGMRGFYRGYLSTVLREIPFSVIQFPIWEFLKSTWSRHNRQPITAWQSSLCGAVAGGTAAALTTPLDVVKTRIILAEKGSRAAGGNVVSVVRQVVETRGVRGLFAGVVPRVMWISLGGSIFLGVYEKVRITVTAWS